MVVVLRGVEKVKMKDGKKKRMEKKVRSRVVGMYILPLRVLDA